MRIHVQIDTASVRTLQHLKPPPLKSVTDNSTYLSVYIASLWSELEAKGCTDTRTPLQVPEGREALFPVPAPLRDAN
jgi:hypothetical protein